MEEVVVEQENVGRRRWKSIRRRGGNKDRGKMSLQSTSLLSAYWNARLVYSDANNRTAAKSETASKGLDTLNHRETSGFDPNHCHCRRTSGQLNWPGYWGWILLLQNDSPLLMLKHQANDIHVFSCLLIVIVLLRFLSTTPRTGVARTRSYTRRSRLSIVKGIKWRSKSRYVYVV